MANVSDIQRNTLLIYVLAFVILLVVIIFTMKVMLKQIPDVLTGLDKVKNEDFIAQLAVKSSDEIGQIAEAFNSMVTNIKALLLSAKDVNSQVNVSATELTNIAETANEMSQEISKAIEQTAIATGEQAKNLEVASMHVFELDKKFEQILDNSSKLNGAVKEAEASNRNGMGAVEDLKNAMI